MHTNSPLSSGELHELKEILGSSFRRDQINGLEGLDGFLTAEVIGPRTLSADELLAAICGVTERSPPVWDSDEKAEHFLKLIMRYKNNIRWQLSRDPHIFRPHFGEALHATSTREITIPHVQPWCFGFMRRADIDGAAWAALTYDQDLSSYFALIQYYTAPNSLEELVQDHQCVKKAAQVVQVITRAVKIFMMRWTDCESSSREYHNRQSWVEQLDHLQLPSKFPLPSAEARMAYTKMMYDVC
jgi:yecA family protein